tara:strand:- start:216 stop:644 length:429 start_codon:yes stop_codon:yes gene_type:complete
MRVKELANKLGITPETVRYYTRIGYLNPSNERGNNYRDYGPNEERYLRFILNARRLGFSVKDIGELLRHADKGHSPCPSVRSLIIERLKETEQRFQEAQELRKRMIKAIAYWADKPDLEPNGDAICHLIEGLVTTSETNPEE